jgi:hypothetical protein
MRVVPGFAVLLGLIVFGTHADVAAQDHGTLQGEWTTDCLPIGKNGRHGYVTRISIREGELRGTSQIYAKASCQTPTVQVNYTGSIREDSAINDVVAIQNIVGAITMTLNIRDVVDHYNGKTDDGCGLTGWQENIPVSVAGKTCGEITFAAAGDRLFDAAWVDGNRLRFGAFPKGWTNTSIQTRPTQPDEVIYYKTGQ